MPFLLLYCDRGYFYWYILCRNVIQDFSYLYELFAQLSFVSVPVCACIKGLTLINAICDVTCYSEMHLKDYHLYAKIKEYDI